MTPTVPSCRAIEPDLVATATGEADRDASQRVAQHVASCPPCRETLDRYRDIEDVLAGMRTDKRVDDHERRARSRLETRLADLRHRQLLYRIFPSPLGHLLIARSDHGIALVEYLGRATTFAASRLARREDIDAVEDGDELGGVYRELLEYVEGRRTRLEWPLDFRLARGAFDRRVLEATAGIPYGAVTSYAHVAAAIGKPTASRAVAQALRWNPVPVVVPCHRVVGSSGTLVGYAGDKVELKQRLLATEGVPTLRAPRDWQIPRGAMYARYENEPAYCLPSCPGMSETPLAKLTLFGSRAHAEACGLTPCETCRPDLHPLAR